MHDQARVRLEEYEVTELYQTPDPEVVIVEMRAKATLTTTGQSFATTSIQILRIREGQIALFRDFANPRVLEDVIGNHVRELAADDLAARLVGPAALMTALTPPRRAEHGQAGYQPALG